MNCDICYKSMRKDVKIDEIRVCCLCRMVWIKAYKKVYNYAIQNY